MSTININASLGDSDIGINRSANKSVTTVGNALDYRRVDALVTEVVHTIDASIGDAGLCMIVNMDDTNFVEVGFATTVYSMKILAGQFALLPLASATSALYLKADTATCEIDIYIREA